MSYLLIFLFFASQLFAAGTIKPNIHARYALLMNIDNGRVLYNKNGYEKIYPASTTKLATGLYLATHFSDRFDDQVEISADILKYATHTYKREMNYDLPPHWLQPDGIDLGIKKGEILPFRMLIHAAMMISANDAANALANHIGEDIPTFMEGLNQFLKSIGCENTYFNNPHGLHHPRHYSTPYDMAIIGRMVAKNPILREIVLTDEYERTPSKLQKGFTFRQTNRLLREGPFYYPYAFGLKTGHTTPAQYNLVAAATNGQRNLVVALHKADKITYCYRDAITLFDSYFAEEPVQRLLFSAEDTVFRTLLDGIKEPVKGILNSDVSISYYPSEEPELKTEIVWHKIHYPVHKGTKIGELLVRDEDHLLAEASVFASESIYRPLFSRFTDFLWTVLALVLPIVFGRFLYNRRRFSKLISPSLNV
jgi:D-alanyl-D-alanine carboxypeptidase (penicillin-binding protein 5/6)